MLEKMGLQVSHALNGSQAVSMYETAWKQQAAYELVLMDCQMPVMDGFQATKLIRAFESAQQAVRNSDHDSDKNDSHGVVGVGMSQGSRAVICAVTAGAEDATPSHCHVVGMNMYLEKPVTRKAIGNVLELARVHSTGMVVVRPD